MFNLTVMRRDKAEQLLGTREDMHAFLDYLLSLYGSGQSHAQFRQDIFAWLASGMKRNGFFVEFGATDGIELSNTYLLEQEFGWTGILAEPGRSWHADLTSNRASAISFDCVWSRTGETLEFNLLEEAALSTLTEFNTADGRRRDRKKGETYPVKTISLVDLLAQHDAPQTIDYLSIDTEGSELDILSAFDFSKYQFNVITCEHNFTPARADIHTLLSQNGYTRVFPHISHCDDWYIRA